MSVDKLNASVKFFLDQYMVKSSNSTESVDGYVYPVEKDIKNRRGSNWNVFDIDVKTKLEPIALEDADLLSVKIENPLFSQYYTAKNLSDNTKSISLIDLYFYAYKEYPFVFTCFDASGQKIENAAVEKTQNSINNPAINYVKFTGPAEAARIEVRLDADQPTPFFVSETRVIDSRVMMEAHKFLAVRLFDSQRKSCQRC